MELLGFENYEDLKDAHYKWVDSAKQTDNRGKENKWTQSIAVGSKTFIEKMKEALGFRAKGIQGMSPSKIGQKWCNSHQFNR